MNAPAVTLVLAGGGHSHALVLRRWARQRQQRQGMQRRSRPGRSGASGSPGPHITLVSRSPLLLYSGLVPALLAGLVPRRDCSINLAALCRQAGVRFVQAEISGLDPQRRLLLLEGRPPLAWDLLSLDVGAVTAEAAGALGVKPLEPLLTWLSAEGHHTDQPLTIRGGGAAALEVALALRGRGRPVALQLRGRQLRLGNERANRHGERLLQAAGVTVRRQVAADAAATLACSGSQGPAWLAAAGLPVQAQGRVLCEPTLQVQGWPAILASGDCAVVSATARPPAGVWAVAQAPTLAANLERLLQAATGGAGDPPAAGAPNLQRWRPRRQALQLLADCSTPAQPRALAVWGPLCLGPGRWLWHCKRWIDQRFVRSFPAGS